MIDFLLEIKQDETSYYSDLFLTQPKVKVHKKKLSHFDVFLWGDPIFDPKHPLQYFSSEIDSFIPEIIQKVNGHFYFLIFDKTKNSYYTGNSLFSILPLYYSIQGGSLYLSSSSEKISHHLGLRKRDKRFILENILFNYPIFNHSAFLGIRLLPANNFILWDKRQVSFHKHTLIENLFTSPKHKTKFDLDNLSDLFIERSAYYFPDTKYIHALTGGFDGRTLVACAQYHNKDFETYSFGSLDSTDTPVANTLSEWANIHFNHVFLDENYYENHSLKNGLDFISNSSGTATFARAHYLYATKVLSKKTSYIVTGNFGSELFRAAHIAGAVISPNLYYLFKAKSFDDAIATLKSSSEKNWLNNAHFEEEWESLIEDLKEFPSFSSRYNTLSLNQKFYVIVFEEVFRKYFGAEMINQYKYLVNRTPFLDFEFFIHLLGSQFAGVHSNFFEHNPLKRFKGQILYSHIIQKAYPDFSYILMDKGYKPIDLLSLRGKLKITQGYIKKKLGHGSIKSPDPFAVMASYLYNKSQLEKKISSQLFDAEAIKKSLLKDEMNNSFFVALSQSIFYRD